MFHNILDYSITQAKSQVNFEQFLRDGEEKTIRFYSDGDYSVEYKGTDAGAMDVTVIEYTEEEETGRRVEYYDVPLTDRAAFNMEVVNANDADETAYTLLDEESLPLERDVDSQKETTELHAVTVDCGRVEYDGSLLSEASILSGQRVSVTALVPEGFSFLHWESESDLVTFNDSESESTSFIMPAEDVQVEAILLMDDNLITDYGFLPDDSGSTVSVRLHSREKTIVFCVLYNRSGQMIQSFAAESPEPGDRDFSFPVASPEVTEVRFILLSDDYTPLCESRTLSLSNLSQIRLSEN